jgi:hypothetical protein
MTTGISTKADEELIEIFQRGLSRWRLYEGQNRIFTNQRKLQTKHDVLVDRNTTTLQDFHQRKRAAGLYKQSAVGRNERKRKVCGVTT